MKRTSDRWKRAPEGRSRPLGWLLAGLLPALLAASAAQGSKTEYRWDVGEDLAPGTFSTWAWQEEGRGPETGPGAPDGHNGRLMVAAIERELAARGYEQLSSAADADVVVRYRAGGGEIGNPRGLEGVYWTGFSYGIDSPQVITRGAIVIEIVDHERDEVIWLGVAIDVIKSYKKIPKVIDKVVEGLIGKLPKAVR